MAIPISSSESANKNQDVGRVLLIGKHAQFGTQLEEALAERGCCFDYAAGSADALQHLRKAPYEVVITDPTTGIEEDLALLHEIRAVRPGVRAILLAPTGTAEEIIAALRVRVFLCKCAPFDVAEIAEYALRAVEDSDSVLGIEILSARRDWISVRMNCHMLTADRLVAFLKEIQTELPEQPREELMLAFLEILRNAVEHGAQGNSSKLLEVAAVHTARAIVFYVADPGPGFRWDSIPHSALSNTPEDPTRHIEIRESAGMRPGGYGILMARGIVDELIYSEVGNESLLIKHTA